MHDTTHVEKILTFSHKIWIDAEKSVSLHAIVYAVLRSCCGSTKNDDVCLKFKVLSSKAQRSLLGFSELHDEVINQSPTAHSVRYPAMSVEISVLVEVAGIPPH